MCVHVCEHEAIQNIIMLDKEYNLPARQWTMAALTRDDQYAETWANACMQQFVCLCIGAAFDASKHCETFTSFEKLTSNAKGAWILKISVNLQFNLQESVCAKWAMSHAHTFHKGDFKCLAQLTRCPLTLWMSWQGIHFLKNNDRHGSMCFHMFYIDMYHAVL